jgi:histidinol-phosphate aminotransferase
MSVYWNERTRLLKPYVPGEQPRDRKFIKLNTNENPYPPPPAVIEAVHEAACDTLRLYPDPVCTELREKAADFYGIKPEEVFTGNGSDEILAFAFAAFFNAGTAAGNDAGKACKDAASCHDPILFPDVTYSFYPVYAGLWDIPYRTIPLKEDFSVDHNNYLDKSGGIVLSNPNAPTGMGIPLVELKKIAEAAERSKRVLVVDEAYIAFSVTEGITTALPLIKEFTNLLVVRTLSKEASLAGLRVGFAMGHEELIQGLFRIHDSFNSYTMDRLALAGAGAVFKSASYYNEITRRIINTRRRVSSGLKELGFRVLPSQANFIFASPPAGCGKSGLEFYTALREQGILVRHFNKPRIDDFLRISIGTDDEMDVFLKACSVIIGE